MVDHDKISSTDLLKAIRNGSITLAGNRPLKIYGRLRCTSGKRMNQNNRVFFNSEQEARRAGYRPCGHCMREAYREWKNKSISSS